jgi:hypothetical protein
VSIIIFGLTLFLPGAIWADVPPPPVNQWIGMVDTSFGDLTEADCRFCHTFPMSRDLHHFLVDTNIPEGSVIPYPDDGDGTYDCIECHGPELVVQRDCTVCHTDRATHHKTTDPQGSDCITCHGSIVDNTADGHYIPTYDPSLVTPRAGSGDGLPPNRYFKLAGGCNYCHSTGLLSPDYQIHSNADLHHNTGLGDDSNNCFECHSTNLDNQIRICEGCHGIDSLHNLQADSPKSPTGTIVIGGEDAGYGHVGSESDCWGCHGFAKVTNPSNYPDRHHNLYGETIPSTTEAPYGTPGDPYGCLSCHDTTLTVERNCLSCHPTWTGEIEDVLNSFDESVEGGDLGGVGSGYSANNKLNAYRNMLVNISNLIDGGNITEACQQISAAMKKCDGVTPPPDFVDGDAALSLYTDLNDLWTELGCTSP